MAPAGGGGTVAGRGVARVCAPAAGPDCDTGVILPRSPLGPSVSAARPIAVIPMAQAVHRVAGPGAKGTRANLEEE